MHPSRRVAAGEATAPSLWLKRVWAPDGHGGVSSTARTRTTLLTAPADIYGEQRQSGMHAGVQVCVHACWQAGRRRSRACMFACLRASDSRHKTDLPMRVRGSAFNHDHACARARTSSRSPSNAMIARRVSNVASASPPTVPCARSLHPRQGRDLACNCTQPGSGRVRPSVDGSHLVHGIAPPVATCERRVGRAKSESRRMEPPGAIPARPAP